MRKKISNPRNTHEKKYLDPQNTNGKMFWNFDRLTRKNFGPTKARWHKTYKTHDGTKTTFMILKIPY